MFTLDIYGAGRTILASLTKGEHIILDDDDEYLRCYKSQEQFEDDMDKLFEINPLAHDLVQRCFSCRKQEEYVVT